MDAPDLTYEELSLLTEAAIAGVLVVRPVSAAAGRDRREGRRYSLAERLVDRGFLARTVDVGERPSAEAVWSAYAVTAKGRERVGRPAPRPGEDGAART